MRMLMEPHILYVGGPGNIIGTFEQWQQGKDDISQVAVTYSRMFFECCQALGARAYIIASNPQKNKLETDLLTIEHRPLLPIVGKGGLFYHLACLQYSLSIVWTAIRLNARVVVIQDINKYWFVYYLLRCFRIQVVPSFHNTLWLKFGSPKRTEKLLLTLAGSFFKDGCAGILAVSQEIASQLKRLTGAEDLSVHQFVPFYRSNFFQGIEKPTLEQHPLRILFAGRVEQHKGVFDLLEMARYLKQKGYQDFVFDICGNGGAFEELQQRIQQMDLAANVVCHGYCTQDRMKAMYGQSHIVIVPTCSNFAEGFNKVIAEGILAGRPVITSAACPALGMVKDAVMEAEVDNPVSYAEAILALRNDPKLYAQKCQQASKLQPLFYEPSKSWGKNLEAILRNLSLVS